MRFLLLALLTAVALPATAQDAPADTVMLAPGDGTLVTDWLASGTKTYTLKLLAPMQQDIGTVSETTTVENGRVTRVATMSIPMQGMMQTDSLVADAATLMPLTHSSSGGQADISLEFMDEGVVGMVSPRQGEATTVMLMTDAAVFDGGWMGEIAQSIPFVEGAVTKVPSFFAQSPEETADAVLTVTGQETVTTPSGDRTAWAVTGDMGPITMTYLVDAETRALLKTRFSPQPGVELEIVPGE